MEIPIPELPSLCRHIYHRCVSLNAEHTIIGTHLCHRYGDSYTQITVIGSTYIYITDTSVFILSMQLLGHTYVLGMEIPTPKLPPLGRHIYHRCLSLCWAYNYWNPPMPQQWRFLYPNYRHWVDIYITDPSVFMLSIQLFVNSYDPGMEIPTSELPSLGRHIYITDASVSMLSIKLLEHTYVPAREIPIPELPSLGRHIYHSCASLYAEHTIIERHLCLSYGDSYTRNTVIGSTYISQMSQSLCWAYKYWNTPMLQVWRFLYQNYRHWVDIYITYASVSMLSIQ